MIEHFHLGHSLKLNQKTLVDCEPAPTWACHSSCRRGRAFWLIDTCSSWRCRPGANWILLDLALGEMKSSTWTAADSLRPLVCWLVGLFSLVARSTATQLDSTGELSSGNKRDTDSRPSDDCGHSCWLLSRLHVCNSELRL